MDKAVLLSFDVEEFDIPTEYGQSLDEPTQVAVGAEGLSRVLDLLDRAGVTATFFCTANFARQRPELMQRLASRHEVASHGMYHSRFEPAHLLDSRKLLEDLTGQRVAGFRMARLKKVDDALVSAAGYAYDSSENPIWLPGRYNNFFKKRTAHRSSAPGGNGLVKLPISATPLVRFPLFWLAFKNAPLSIIKAASAWTLRHDGYLNIFFHPWEFTDLSAYRLPGYVKRRDGDVMIHRLENYIEFLKRRGRFVTLREFVERFGKTD